MDRSKIDDRLRGERDARIVSGAAFSVLHEGAARDRSAVMRGASVTRLTDLPPDQAKRLAELECPNFATRPWVTGPTLPQRRVAIVSSAPLVLRGADPLCGRGPPHRAIPPTLPAGGPLCRPHL